MKPFLHVKLVRSTIGTDVHTRKVVAGLGLRRIGNHVIVANTPSFRGMVKKILHLIEVEEVSPPASTASAAKV